jgi:SAM-dependent methyltransferase
VGGRSFPEFDPKIAADARIYDFLIGGKDNFAVDREVGLKLAGRSGKIARWRFPAVENRRFVERAVRYLADAGIRQFIDVGCGMPTEKDNVHQIAQGIDPGARVVYVDYDPVVITHQRAMIHSLPAARVIQADVRSPKDILGHADVTSFIDFDRPVAILLAAVLQLIPDHDDPRGIVATFRDALAPDSYLMLSHMTGDGPPEWAASRFLEIFKEVREPMILRSRAEIRALLTGLDLIEPGLVDGANWHPDEAESPPSGWLTAGVARKL